MVSSCAMSSNCVWLSVWLQIIFCPCVKECTLFSFLWSLLRKNGRSLLFRRRFMKKKTPRSNDKTIIELGFPQTSWFVTVSQINHLRSRRLTQTIDLLASNKSRSGYRKKPDGYSLCWSIRGTFAIFLAEVQYIDLARAKSEALVNNTCKQKKLIV